MKKLIRLSAVIICVLAVVVTATAAYAARTGLDGYCHNQDCPYYGGECRNESCGYYCGTPDSTSANDGYCHNENCPYFGGKCCNESCGYYCGTPADNGSGNGNGTGQRRGMPAATAMEVIL